MTIDELKAAIERRGYFARIVRDLSHPDCAEIVINRGSEQMAYGFTLLSLESVKENISDYVEHVLRPLSKGWKHMQCAQCGTPVFASFKWVDEPGVALKWYGVCSIQAGPYTEPLQVCSGCGVEFGYPPPLKEIVD